MATPLFQVEELTVGINRTGEWLPAVVDASFAVARGEVLALVGESGSGKSLMAMGAVDLLRAGSKVTDGRTIFMGEVLQDIDEQRWSRLVGTGIGTLFQDPIGSWNPLELVGVQSAEVLEEHYQLTRDEIGARIMDALGEVKLPSRRKFFSLPQQMSRGEAQRAMLAAVLLSEPALLIADEPVSGLDTTIAAAVLDLIADLVAKRKMAMILVTHDMGVVARMADRVAVVYGGRIVEQGPVGDIFRSPLHPYTEGLLGSIPWAGSGRLRAIPGDAPDLAALPHGCPFAPRCDYVERRCLVAVPPVERIGRSVVRCLRAWDLELKGVSSR